MGLRGSPFTVRLVTRRHSPRPARHGPGGTSRLVACWSCRALQRTWKPPGNPFLINQRYIPLDSDWRPNNSTRCSPPSPAMWSIPRFSALSPQHAHNPDRSDRRRWSAGAPGCAGGLSWTWPGVSCARRRALSAALSRFSSYHWRDRSRARSRFFWRYRRQFSRARSGFSRKRGGLSAEYAPGSSGGTGVEPPVRMPCTGAGARPACWHPGETGPAA